MRPFATFVVLIWAGAAPTLCRAQLQDENLLVKLPTGYKVATDIRKPEMIMTEMIPEGEDVDTWNEMVTTQVFRGRVLKDLAPFEASMERRWLAACPKSSVAPIQAWRELGLEVRLWLENCPNNPGTGRPEFTLFKAIAGNDSFYVVQKAFRFIPTQPQIDPWMRYLRDVIVCDTRVPDRKCPIGQPKSD